MKSVLLFSLLLFGLGLEMKVQCQDNPCRSRDGPDFYEYNNHCYLFVNVEVQWTDAESTCNQFHGSMASIHTRPEYDFIRGLIYQGAGYNKETWVGGNDRETEGVWKWIDGSPFDFTGWGPGEPNNLGGNENCMELNLYGRDYINDTPCDRRLPFVCARYKVF